MTDDPRDYFLESLDRCSSNANFIPTFYDRFLSSSFEIRHKFRNTDFKKQNEMLLRSLRLAAGGTSGDREALKEIRKRAETHDRHHLNIAPRLYDVWLETVIQTASEFDEFWDEDVEMAWNQTLGHVVKQMIKFY